MYRSAIIGQTIEAAEKELNKRFGKKWVVMHEGMPGNVDRDETRINVWVCRDGKILKVTRG